MARRNVDGQELLYHSIKYTNQIFVLSELKTLPNSTNLTVRVSMGMSCGKRVIELYIFSCLSNLDTSQP